MTMEKAEAPRVFLSYAWEDAELAKRVASDFQENGIDVWWAGWSMASGHSLRQKIDEGLSGCTHFVVLLTAISVTKPWVKVEIDAGLVRAVSAKARFIPLRSNLSPASLPPLLQTMLSPAIDDFNASLRDVIHDIFGISRKPPLGPAPAATREFVSGYSDAAAAVAKILVEASETGNGFDPVMSHKDLADSTGLSKDDLTDALYELQALVQDERWDVRTKDELFVIFDKAFMPWDPEEDALKLLLDLFNDPSFPKGLSEIADWYGWSARRLNPAIHYLAGRKLADVFTASGMGPWGAVQIEKNDATRRFFKNRSKQPFVDIPINRLAKSHRPRIEAQMRSFLSLELDIPIGK